MGCYRKSGGVLAAYLLSGGRFTEISYPEASTTGGYGINDQGDIVGTWNDAAGKTRGYSLIQGKFTSFEFPGSQATAVDLSRIANSGHITAPYRDARGKTKSLLLSCGRYTSFEAPGAASTTVLDNRARGNSGADLNWDGKGENRLESNACENCAPASACQK